MPLPIQSAPIYTLTIPSTKKDIKYRPFLVREEKSLLIAQMSNNIDIMLDTLKEVIKACVLDKIDKMCIRDSSISSASIANSSKSTFHIRRTFINFCYSWSFVKQYS